MKTSFLLFFLVCCQFSFCYGSDSQVDYKIYVIKGPVSQKGISEVENLFIHDTSNLISLEHFNSYLGRSKFFWLYLKPEFDDTSSVFVLSLNERFAKIMLYPYPYKYSTSQSGLMAPLNQKSLSGGCVFLNGGNGPFLLKVENLFQVQFKVNDIRVQTIEEYLDTQKKNDLFQGFAQGFFWLMLLYNLVLFLIGRKKIHVYYVIYIFFNALFLLFTSGFSEVYLFPGNYRLNLTLLTFQLLGVFFYVLFLRMALLGHCTAYTPKVDSYLFKPFAFLILLVNAAIGSTVFYRMDLYTLGSSISNILSTLVGITLFGLFYRKSDQFMRLIMIGSVILFVLGYVNVFYTFLYRQTEFFYTIGLLIELMVLTYALNKQHFKEQGEVEHKNRKLANELETKNRELVNMAMQLSAKAAVLDSVKEKMGSIDDLEKYKPLYTEIKLASNANEIMWKDFEKHFNETHPGFYRNLTEVYPALTTSEIRLCAFLKLNLNTKEIAMITQRSAHSIEAMRSRIRQKLKLGREGSLTLILSRF